MLARARKQTHLLRAPDHAPVIILVAFLAECLMMRNSRAPQLSTMWMRRTRASAPGPSIVYPHFLVALSDSCVFSQTGRGW